MRVLILGAGGMIGAKLAQRLMGEGRLAGRPIAALDLVDLSAPLLPPGMFPATAAPPISPRTVPHRI
jgi:nucleoside-diphosphate-sugar epimerase